MTGWKTVRVFGSNRHPRAGGDPVRQAEFGMEAL